MGKPDDIDQATWNKAESAFDLMLCNCIEASGTTEQLRADSIEPLARAILSAKAEQREADARKCEAQANAFLSPEYATGQPLSSFQERFACEQCASAIRAGV